MLRKLCIPGLVVLILSFACSKDNNIADPVVQGDYTLKVYALERSPKINRTGAGMDFVHDADLPDTTYYGPNTPEDFKADAMFYNLMVYFTDENGDTQSEGSPAILLEGTAMAALVGTGIDFFTEFSDVTPDMINNLASDASNDLSLCKNSDGLYDRDLVLATYEQCVIGNKFRGRLIVIPEGGSEQDVQPVFLIKTSEGSYVKFMVKQFKGDGADKQKTIVQWQLIQM